jgi:predicted phosphodiesterase
MRASNDQRTLVGLIPTLRSIIEHHMNGTKFGIGVDPNDGLLRQGAQGYQLTWMDAKAGDWVVTPRRGKAVEINALWLNALMLLAGWLREEGDPEAVDMEGHAARARDCDIGDAPELEIGTLRFELAHPRLEAVRSTTLLARLAAAAEHDATLPGSCRQRSPVKEPAIPGRSRALQVGDEIERAVGRHELALDAVEESGVDMLVAGHAHHATSQDAGDLVTRAGGVLVVQAGTATSTRVREQEQRFNTIDIDDSLVTVTVHGWTGDDFKANDARAYEWVEGRWKLRKAPEPAH